MPDDTDQQRSEVQLVDERENLVGKRRASSAVAGLPGASLWPMNTRGSGSSTIRIKYVLSTAARCFPHRI